MKITFKKLRESAVIPSYATEGSAGMDLCACIDESITLAPNEIRLIPTGLAAETDTNDAALLIYARSGLASKHGITLANSVGVIDCDYRGEWKIALHNDTDEPQTIAPHERIAQMVVIPFLPVEFTEAADLTDTERGAGGFGSTGRQ